MENTLNNNTAVAYCRVSTVGQKNEGFSIKAQSETIHRYAQEKGITIVKEFTEAASARKPGRSSFENMLSYLRKNPQCRLILVEKTDRLYRNDRDRLKIEDCGVNIFFVKEGSYLSATSGAYDVLQHDNAVAQAKYQSNLLSEEAKKGLRQKALEGLWPSRAPLGFKNKIDTNKKKIIVKDPLIAPTIITLFEDFATGEYSIKAIHKKYSLMFKSVRKAPVARSSIHTILRDPIYTGLRFNFRGVSYPAKHEAIITVGLFERVQEILNKKNRQKPRNPNRYTFAYKSLFTCGHCGCAIVGEQKKNWRYIYFHCTWAKGKHEGRSVPQTAFDDLIAQVLERVKITPAVSTWMTVLQAEREAFKDQNTIREINKWERLLDGFDKRFGTLLELLSDGTIDRAEFDRRHALLKEERSETNKTLEAMKASKGPAKETQLPLYLFHQWSQNSYAQQPPEMKNRLLKLLVKNAVWDNAALAIEFRPPFNVLIGKKLMIQPHPTTNND